MSEQRAFSLENTHALSSEDLRRSSLCGQSDKRNPVFLCRQLLKQGSSARWLLPIQAKTCLLRKRKGRAWTHQTHLLRWRSNVHRFHGKRLLCFCAVWHLSLPAHRPRAKTLANDNQHDIEVDSTETVPGTRHSPRSKVEAVIINPFSRPYPKFLKMLSPMDRPTQLTIRPHLRRPLLRVQMLPR